MSHIDSFKHEIVGLFGGMPVYHPLEDIDGDFKCTTAQLVLGGGSGEHPALVITNPTGAVACFLDDQLKSMEGSNVNAKYFPLKAKIDEWKPLVQPWLAFNDNAVLEFTGWDIRTYAAFDALCRSRAMPNPYSDDEGMSLEAWLVRGFGEFVFFAMPELASALIGRLDEPYRYFNHVYYNNILLVPPNMPTYANGGNAFTFGRRNT